MFVCDIYVCRLCYVYMFGTFTVTMNGEVMPVPMTQIEHPAVLCRSTPDMKLLVSSLIFGHEHAPLQSVRDRRLSSPRRKSASEKAAFFQWLSVSVATVKANPAAWQEDQEERNSLAGSLKDDLD